MKKSGSFFALLIKQYIIFTLVVVILIYSLIIIEKQIENTILRYPRIDRPLGQQELILAGKYKQLKMKKMLGTDGYFEVLDKDHKVIYSDRPEIQNTYSELEIRCIPEYDSNESYWIETFITEEGDARNLLQLYSYEEDSISSEPIFFQILDQNGNVLYSSNKQLSVEKTHYSKKELGYLTLQSDTGYESYKYSYRNQKNEKETLLMHTEKVDEKSYQKFSIVWKASIPIFAVCYILMTSLFIIWLNKKVKEPLVVLNKGMIDFTEGKRDTLVVYKGQTEFENICESFNKMSKRLKESEDLQKKLLLEKQKMLADISHDLKTPITVILGYAKAICDGIIEAEKKEQYLKVIYTKAEGLNELIDIFYIYSKLEHHEYELVLEQQDIVEYLREYLAVKYEEIELQGSILDADIPETTILCEIDRVQLKRVFENVISNALRHNRAGTTIYLQLKETEDSINIQIGDDGIGIPEEIRKFVFDPFVVGDESRNNRQGSGLGLAVARKIIEKHGGTINLVSSSNKKVKTLFQIILPKSTK